MYFRCKNGNKEKYNGKENSRSFRYRAAAAAAASVQ